MATQASSILARGEMTDETWFDEIQKAWSGYALAVQRVSEPGLEPWQVAGRYASVQWWANELRNHGVTVCGYVGHA